MQFSDPNVNPYAYGGDGGMPYMDGMGRPTRPRRRRGGCLGCLPVVLVLLLLAFIVGHFGFDLSFGGGAQAIPVSYVPTLILQGYAHDLNVIHVHGGGPVGQISIQRDHFLNIPLNVPLDYQESGDKRVVVYPIDSMASGTLDITVPTASNLKIDTNQTAVEVENVNGQVVLETISGALTVQKSTLTGPSVVRSNSGVVKLLDVTLSGAVDLDNNQGDLTFDGVVKPDSTQTTDHFTANGGMMTVTLHQGTAATLDVSTLNGEIVTNLPGAKPQQDGSTLRMSAQFGDPPRALLTLYNNSGSIKLDEQGER